MAEIKVSLDIRVTEGPTFSLKPTLAVQQYERVDIDLPAGDHQAIPVEDAGQIALVLIKRSDYPPNAKKFAPGDLYYRLDDAPDKINLEDQHALVGAGVSQLLSKVPQKITFYNNNANDPVTVTLLVARILGPAQKSTTAAAPPAAAPAGTATTSAPAAAAEVGA